MRFSRGGWYLAVLIAGLGFLPSPAHAMPNFARKYKADCGMCHTAVPKLNRLGYEFRAAGYRMPNDIGKDEKEFNLGDMFAARLQEEVNYHEHDAPGSGSDYTNSQLNFVEATLYPMTGSWGRNFASISELSMASGDIFEVENAYVRGVFGDAQRWFQFRVGIMHPWEGFGASDRPLGNSRTLFQKMATASSTAGGFASGSPFYLWNLDESAIELGYNSAGTGTSIAGRVSNGLVWNPEATNQVDPAQGGALSKGNSDPGHNGKNYQFFVNQFINWDSAVSAYYYHGTIPFADPSAGPSPLVTFDRWALYGNYQVLQPLNLLAGYAGGKDSVDVAAATGLGLSNPANLGTSNGWFVEGDYRFVPNVAAGLRYDAFDPSDKVNRNTVNAYTASANWRILDGLQMIADYQHKTTDLTAGGSNKDDVLQIRGIIIF